MIYKLVQWIASKLISLGQRLSFWAYVRSPGPRVDYMQEFYRIRARAEQTNQDAN